MTLVQQDQFLADVKLQITQYLYREFETSFDNTVEILQTVSGIGPINWHLPENQTRIQHVFTELAAIIGTYTILDGDFRTFILTKFVGIVYNEFKNELFASFMKSEYNVNPSSIVGSLDTTPTLAPPQNTNFPGLDNTSSKMNPGTRKLVPSTIYNDDL